MADTLLLIEDEANLARELACHFEVQGWEVTHSATVATARKLLDMQRLEPLVVLSDMSLPDGNALDLLEHCRDRQLGGEWILLTGYGGVADSVRALRLGAFDFLEKPCEPDRLDLVVAGAARSARAQRQLTEQTARQTRHYMPDSFVGGSVRTTEIRALLARLSQVPFSALTITGETGTGKGRAARIVHHAGPRARGSLVEINCAALPKELLESELFGHEAGAFTGASKRRRGLFEQANGGTLFLDEIGELAPELQTKLLRAIDEKTIRRIGAEREIVVDVQIIAATNRNLTDRVRAGAFREDLYHRINVFSLRLPPLRERKADLRELLPLFVAEYNLIANKRVTKVPRTVWRCLRLHDWPGNVRELRNAVERCVLFADGEVFPAEWLQLETRVPAPSGDQMLVSLDGTMSLDEIESRIIREVLERNRQNVTAAARVLGTTRDTLRYRIEKHRLQE